MPETCCHLDTVAHRRRSPDRPVIRSFEAAEDWLSDERLVEVEGAAPAPQHR